MGVVENEVDEVVVDEAEVSLVFYVSSFARRFALRSSDGPEGSRPRG